MAKSEWDGSLLPVQWRETSPVMKSQVIAHLQGRTLQPPYWWQMMSSEDRSAVALHLCAVGSLNADKHERARRVAGFYARAATRKAQCPGQTSQSTLDRETARRYLNTYRDRYTELTTMWSQCRDGGSVPSVAQAQAEIDAKRRGMLYPSPNGGKRILPSIYTKLRDTWLRANAVYQEPAKMNQGHLKNTVALLNESHINLVDKMTAILGRMHAHLHNRPDLQAKLVDLFHDFEALTVDEIYPIVELLASHIEPEPPTLQIDPNTDWIDGADYPF